MSGRQYAPDILIQERVTTESFNANCDGCAPGKCKHRLYAIYCYTLINGGEVRRTP